MVVNCLPLYQPPNEEAQAEAEAAAGDGSGQRRSSSCSGSRSKLIKARSMESITSSQLGDEEHDSKVGGGIATPPRRKTSLFSHYSVTIHNRVDVSAVQQSTARPSDHSTESEAPKANGSGAQDNVAVVQEGKGEEKIVDEGEGSRCVNVEVAVEEASTSQQPESDAANGEGNSAPLANGRQDSDRPGGDDISNEVQVVKSDDQDSLQAQDNIQLSEEVKAKPDSKNRHHPKLQKSRSARTSLSPDVDTSDSEENAFSVNYVEDQFLVPQLKRSSGSVSFYTPPITISQKSELSCSSGEGVKETLLEMSGENKLDDDQEEGGGGGGGGASEGTPMGRDKSLSTAKPPLLEEADSILQTSASSSPTAPAQSATPLSTSPPPTTAGGPAQAPPTTGSGLALRASPLPPPPVTLDKDYTERSGWLNKLSHRKGVFGDKWQKRYFVLHRSWLYYFKKYGVRV